MVLRLVIVDDNPHFLEAARELLEREGMSVVGVASTGAEARARVAELRPDATLVDIDLGDESGFEVARQLAGNGGEGAAPVVLISTYAEQDLYDLIEASPAVGFVSKSNLSGSSIQRLLVTGPRGT